MIDVAWFNPCFLQLIQHPVCFLDINPSKYIKIYTIQKTLPKWELLKILLFAPLLLPAPNNIFLEEWVSRRFVDSKCPTND